MPAKSSNAKSTYFTPKLFQFLRDLRANNDRAWFQANKERYEADVKEPMLQFIADFNNKLHKISRNFNADPRPVGGSMFRIYRDTRFSKDKTPYKTAATAHFPHRDAGKDVHTPGFYFHLEPGNCLAGGGIWQPDTAALSKIRDRIANRSKEWQAAIADGLKIQGDSLKRPPRGYDADHPFVEDLKRKDYYAMFPFSEKQACAPDFMDRIAEIYRSASPLVRFLTKAAGLNW